jgi:beta-N-acetylhexosaminidase
MDNTRLDAYAVLFPAFGGLTLDASTKELLKAGCKAILLGESREEYVARKMSDQRVSREKEEDFMEIAKEATYITGSGCIVAVDQELGGIQRLHNLVPQLPMPEDVFKMSADEIEKKCLKTAETAKNFGVNLFLAPILDMITGNNPWLKGRTLGTDANQIKKVTKSYILGVQAAGVAATAKHFPGYPHVTGDPAVEKAKAPVAMEEIWPIIDLFREAVKSGVKAVMTGPAIVDAVDPNYPASVSGKTVKMLREEIGFSGLIISDDLDAKGILLNSTLEETAVNALNAGADLLLLAGGKHLHDIADAIVKAVDDGLLPAERLHTAAEKVRETAEELNA